MVTERKLIETISDPKISNISIYSVHTSSPLIRSATLLKASGFSVYKKNNVAEEYTGPAISLTFFQALRHNLSGTGTAQLSYYIPQTNSYQQINNLNINISSTPASTLSSDHWLGMQRSASFDISNYLLTDFKNTQFRVLYNISFSGYVGGSEPLESRISFTQTFQNIPTSVDKLLSYFLNKVQINMALQVSRPYTDGNLGFNIITKGEATYQPSIIGKTLYF